MSADRSRRVLRLLLAGSLAGASGVAAAAQAPDPAFLEYLGSWEGADDEWLIVEESAAPGKESSDDRKKDEENDRQNDRENDQQKDPAPGQEESAENGAENGAEKRR